MNQKSLFIGAAVIAVIMVFTKPNKDHYLDYITEQITIVSKESFCKGLPQQQDCKFTVSLLASQGKPMIKQFIGGATKESNYVLLSLYETEMPSQKLTTIAAFGNFYTFK